MFGCKILLSCLPKWLYHIAFPSAIYESLLLHILAGLVLSVLWILATLIEECVLVIHVALFCISWWHMVWNTFSYVYLSFGYLLWWASVKVFDQFFSLGSCFLMLNIKNSLYILDNCPLSGISFANIFSQSVACFLSLLTLSFTYHKFSVLMKSSLWIISFMDYVRCCI